MQSVPMRCHQEGTSCHVLAGVTSHDVDRELIEGIVKYCTIRNLFVMNDGAAFEKRGQHCLDFFTSGEAPSWQLLNFVSPSMPFIFNDGLY